MLSKGFCSGGLCPNTHHIDLFITRHKVVHNGGSLNFKGLLFNEKTNYLVQILQSLSYKVCSIILPKFNTFRLFIPILGTFAIIDQTACCYNVTTSKTGLLELGQLFFYGLFNVHATELVKHLWVPQKRPRESNAHNGRTGRSDSRT